MREGPLHAAVKALLAEPGDRLEVPVGRFVIDLVRADGELVEVQTGSFGALGKKLDALLDEHRMRIVHPVAAERRIVRVDQHGQVLAARRSPKRETAVAVFVERAGTRGRAPLHVLRPQTANLESGRPMWTGR
jgi:hypothetical protein